LASAEGDATGDQTEHRGLDRGVARKQAFLQAAREVFLEHGYEAASVNEVVRRAGGSLATLYSQYGSKEGLFLAVAHDHQERFIERMMPENYKDLPLRQGLAAFAGRYLDELLNPDNVAFYRIFVSEGRKHPQLLRRQVTTNMEKLGEALDSYMREHPDENGARILQPRVASNYFFDLIRGRMHYRVIYDPNYGIEGEERQAHIAAAIDFFLNGALGR
jgi:AcrR family transcriptional regulator